MDAHRHLASKRVRLVGALTYATVVCVALLRLVPKSSATAPLLLIVLGIPLALRLVPRNYFYGMRSPRTLWTSEETWYRQNVITGVVLMIVGILWFAVLAIRQ